MKKRSRNRNTLKKVFPTKEILKKHLLIDVEKQEIIRVSTGHKYIFTPIGKKRKYYQIHFSHNGKGYRFLVHRLFFYWNYGYLPDQIDHIDQNSFNNNILNLREINDSNNQRNRKKYNLVNGKKTSSKYKNVSWDKKAKKWRARVRLNKKYYSLGLYNNEDEAGEAVNQFYIKNNLTDYACFNDTPQQKMTKNNQFDPLPQEMNHIKVLFQDIEPLVDLK